MQRPSVRVVGFAFFCLFLSAVAWYGARWAENLPGRLVAASQAALEKKALELQARFFAIAHFEPRLRVQQRVLSETTSEIAEISVLEKNIEVEREFAHTWAGSSKKLRLRGKYRVKVGFNLLNKFEIQVEKGHRRLVLPPAEILSVEQTEIHVDALENGFWNPISADDWQTSILALQEQARSQSRNLLPQARQTFLDRLDHLGDSRLEIIPALP